MSKRYIDADELIYILDGAIQGEEVTGNAPLVNAHDIICSINDMPTVDVAEVVRCKDCKYCEEEEWYGTTFYQCNCESIRMNSVYKNFFCGYGEKRDE